MGAAEIFESIALNQLPVGQKAKVKSLQLDDGNKRRLQDLGIIEGTEIKALFRSPAGNPIAYLVRGAVFALRKDVTENILVIR